MLKYRALPLLLLPLSALAEMTVETDACIDELRKRVGNVGGEVVKQQSSEAGTSVRLRDAKGAEYECIVWSGPEIAEFRLVQDEGVITDDDGGAMSEAPSSNPIVSGRQRVSFAPGTSGAAMSATLQPETSVRYILGARDGQFLNVDIGSYGGALDYRIYNPDGSLLLDLVSSDKPYRGQLWQSGDHIVEVLNAGAQSVSFDIGIGIE